jgi:hypothetical protein
MLVVFIPQENDLLQEHFILLFHDLFVLKNLLIDCGEFVTLVFEPFDFLLKDLDFLTFFKIVLLELLVLFGGLDDGRELLIKFVDEDLVLMGLFLELKFLFVDNLNGFFKMRVLLKEGGQLIVFDEVYL